MNSDKFTRFCDSVQQKKKLGVAFSGGVDSTLLLSLCIEVLGLENVIALHVDSVLQSSQVKKHITKIITEEFPRELTFVKLVVNPLSWPLFCENSDQRCYYCKKQIYTLMLDEIVTRGIATVADGTNVDDFKEYRPGLKAIRELGIFTPLQESGFTKNDIRRMAQERGLSNYELASNSCLATRVSHATSITPEYLEIVEQAESFLADIGFIGTRVRVGDEYTIIEIAENDFCRFVNNVTRRAIDKEFSKIGLPRLAVALRGR